MADITDDDDRPARDSTVLPVPDTVVAGDWTVLSALAVAVAALLFWRRRTARGR